MAVHGVGVGRAVAVGPVLTMPQPLPEPADRKHGGDAAAEKAAVASAVAAAASELEARAARAEGEGRAIIGAAIQMARDPMLADDVAARIDAGATGERAVFEAFRSFQEQLTALGGDKAQRATDLGDVSQRIIAALRGMPAPGVPESDTPFILLAHDLAPADTALLDLSTVLGLITREGGPTGHTAILARDRGIPAVVGVGAGSAIADGSRVVLDAASGVVIVDPSDEQLADARQRIAEQATRAAAPIAGGALADGTRIPLLANLGSPEDAAAAVALGAEGVGLFRTEFLFLGARTAPSVADQQAQYQELLRQFPGKRV
ncbi:MAG: PEP-utilizing enzyme, partial [Leifsonia sp.]